MTSPSDATEGIRVSLRLIVTHVPEQRFTEHGQELTQVRGSVVDSKHQHPHVVVRFSGKHQADLYKWATVGKHLDVEGTLEVRSWTPADNKLRIALLIEARDVFPLNPDQPDLSRVGVTTRTTARRAPSNGSGVVRVPEGVDRADLLRKMLAEA